MGGLKRFFVMPYLLACVLAGAHSLSPQPHRNTRELANKFEVPMQFYVDRDNRAARALGIEHHGGVAMGISGYGVDTVLPTVLITDEKGRTLFADLTDNYRVRPEPATFIRILDGEPSPGV